MNPFSIGAAAAMLQGFGLLCLTVYFGVLFPSAGISSPADFGNPAKYLPVVAAHPSWFYVPAWGFGLLADALFLIALVALRERLQRLNRGWTDMAVLFAAVGVTLYLVGHVVNVAWAPELITQFSQAGMLTPATAAQYVVLSRIYNAAMLGGSLLTGIALLIVGALALRTRIYSRAFGALSIAAGLLDAAMVVALLPPALPLTGVVLVWLGILMWRDDWPISLPSTGRNMTDPNTP